MNTRALTQSDIEQLKVWHTQSGFDYEFPLMSKMEAAIAVVDSDDNLLMVASAEKLVQLYLWVDPKQHPAVKLHGVRLLHKQMAVELRKLGYNSAEAFLPPSIAKCLSRRLVKTFGWVKNWASWTVKF